MFEQLMFMYMEYLPSNKFLRSIIILLVFYILAQLVVFIFERIFLKLASKTKTDVDDKIVKAINKPISLMLIIYGITLAMKSFGLDNAIETNLEKFLISTIILIVAWIISSVFDVLIDSWGYHVASKTKSGIDDAILPLFHKFVRITIFILAFLYVLDYWGVEIAPLLASLGIAGLAVAFALQKVLGNIFGGISMILDKTIKVGDVVKIDNGQISGKVLDVGLRSTKIRTWDNEVIIVPNGQLADSTVQNLVLPDPTARVVVEFGVEYGSDPEKVKKVALSSIKKVEGLMKEPEPHVKFINMADSALIFRLYFYVESYSQRFAAKDLVTTTLYNNLNKAKIGIPFPQMTVHMKKK